MFNAAKDALTSKAALHFCNKQIERYGKLLDLQIDSRAKTVIASCLLHGELEPVEIRVDDYRIESVAGKNYVQASGFSCNRPWLETLLMDFACDRRIELPAGVGSLL